MNNIKKMISIIGAGHQGIAMAAHFAMNGERVALWNRTPENIKDIKKTKVIKCKGVINGKANIERVSSEICEVISDIIFVTTPSFAHRDVARVIAPFLKDNSVIFLNPGRTFGAIEFLRELQKNNCRYVPTVVETQSIVYTCRRLGSDEVCIYALKGNVPMAVLGKENIDSIVKQVPECIRKNFKLVKNVLDTSMGNVGMILHCAPVLLNVGWIECEKYNFKYYYDGITPSIGAMIDRMDNERVQVARAMGVEAFTLVEWFRDVYNVEGDTIYECIQNNEYYRKIDAPHSLKHRYIDEDVPNGLVPIEFLGKELNINTEIISLVITLAEKLCNKNYREIGRKYTKAEISNYIDLHYE